MALWDGRFAGTVEAHMQRFSESLGVDLRMFEQDIDGSIAHATMLGEVGLLTDAEVHALVQGLEQVRGELRDGRYVPDISLEDIHMAVESRLTALVGEVGGRLHTARSRNDQVATDVRLWLKGRLGELDLALGELITALLDCVESQGRTLMPGYTHLQRGQPIWLGHHLLAWCWMLRRDRARVQDALDRVDQSPLGACAMAGTPHPIDRLRSAELLGFAGVMENAMDAVASRDHVQESAAACAICASHLSRMAEELVLWSTREFNFVRISEGWTTGSSIMPQKRNPDAAELVRGRSAQVMAALTALLTLTKGLPLAYNRDLQEDRGALFAAVDTTLDCVRVCAGMWRTVQFNRDRFTAELRGDFSLATELADHLVGQGVPFREAHHVAGRIVRDREAKGLDFLGITLEELRLAHPAFGDDALAWLDPESAVERRTSYGGAAWSEVCRQVELLREELSERDPFEGR